MAWSAAGDAILIFGTLASQSDRGIISPHPCWAFCAALALAPMVAAKALAGETETGL